MCCTPTERLLIVLTLPLAVVVLSIGYRPLGSCPRTAGWSAATLCVGPEPKWTSAASMSAVEGNPGKRDYRVSTAGYDPNLRQNRAHCVL